MQKKRMIQRIHLVYSIGAILSLGMVIIAIIERKSGFTLIFPMVAFFTYIGVIFRGYKDPISWGNNSKSRSISLIIGVIFIIATLSIGLLPYLMPL